VLDSHVQHRSFTHLLGIRDLPFHPSYCPHRSKFHYNTSIQTHSGGSTMSPTSPTPRDLIQLDRPFAVTISPDGQRAAIHVARTNWKDNRYEVHILLWEAAGDALCAI
jgi:hypothetical protein